MSQSSPARPPHLQGAAPVVTVVMPAHNEEALLARSVGEVAEALRERSIDFEILVAENGSTDATLAVAHDLAAKDSAVRVLTRPKADYGKAMRGGILAATGDEIVVFDTDYYDGGFVDRVLAILRTDTPPAIVVGSKRAPGTNDTRAWPRRLITATFATVLRVGFGLGVSDTHGMKAMRREAVAPVAERCVFGTDLFDTELILRVEAAGMQVAEVPVVVEEKRPSRTPIVRRVLRTLVGLVRLRFVLWRDARHDARHGAQGDRGKLSG